MADEKDDGLHKHIQLDGREESSKDDAQDNRYAPSQEWKTGHGEEKTSVTSAIPAAPSREPLSLENSTADLAARFSKLESAVGNSVNTTAQASGADSTFSQTSSQAPANPSLVMGSTIEGENTGGSGNGGGGTASAPSPINPVKQFFRDLIAVLTEPRKFFETRYPHTSFTYALTFGIICAWIAAFLSWMTRMIRHETLFDGLMQIRDKLHGLPYWNNLPDNFWAQGSAQVNNAMPAWSVEMLGILLSPFQSLFSLVCYAIVIFVGCYLFVPSTPTTPPRDTVELKNSVRLVAFASAPVLITAILGFLPFGTAGFIGWVYGFVLLVFAIHVRFRVSGLRGFGIVALPGIIMGIALSCMLGAGLAVLYGLYYSVFGPHGG